MRNLLEWKERVFNRGLLVVVLGLASFSVLAVHAQTFTVLHNFEGADGLSPYAGLLIDAEGNLYGTTPQGGLFSGSCYLLTGCGTVFRLHPKNSTWIFQTLYAFGGDSDGTTPYSGVAFGSDGALYGMTVGGGRGSCLSGGVAGCGVIYRLEPPPTIPPAANLRWKETVIHAFQGGSDGASPYFARPLFDQQGNLYGTTAYGGTSNSGIVFQESNVGGVWAESILHTFTGEDGATPTSSLIFDQSGALLGTTTGGKEGGVAFRLTEEGGVWSEDVLYAFHTSDPIGYQPDAGLLEDNVGNLYGTTTAGTGGYGIGSVYELSPSGNMWTAQALYSFPRQAMPVGELVADSSGNLYGTMEYAGALGWGAVFELQRSAGGWVYRSLHDFTGGSDGGFPVGNVVFDASGNIYGVASVGTIGAGQVWEITP